MGPEFIGRVMRTSAWVTPLVALYVAVYYDLGFAAAMLVGTAWACANLFLLKLLVQNWIHPGARGKRTALLLVCVKFPVLYALGYLALRADALPVIGLLAGFWVPKAVIVLKYLGLFVSRRLGAAAGGRRNGRGLRSAVGHGLERPGAAARAFGRGETAALVVLAAAGIWLVPQLCSRGPDALAAGARSGGEAAVQTEEVAASQAYEGGGAQSDEAEARQVGATEASRGHSDRAAAGHGGAAGATEPPGQTSQGHGEGEEDGGGRAELPNLISVVVGLLPGGSHVAHFLHEWENLFFSLLSMVILGIIAALASRRAALVPGRLQNTVEYLVEKLDEFICGILGPEGRRYVPFLGTLFIYILFMNVFGLIPFMKSPTANPNQTFALSLTVFFYVQYAGIRNLGVKGYILHMAGDPRDVISIFLVPIMLPLHIIGELAKPLSLALRLFGNITGEDVLLVIFVTLGIGMIGFLHLPIGIPLQVPFIFLAMLTSTIQALVFMLLSTVYFLMMMPHDEH